MHYNLTITGLTPINSNVGVPWILIQWVYERGINKMEEKEWLESLKVGDKVCVEGRLSGVRIVEIERITKIYFIINDEKFRRVDGYKLGCDSWNFIQVKPITDEVRASILSRRLEVKIHNGGLRKLPLDGLKAIEGLVNSTKK